MTPDSNRHELRAALTLVERIRVQLAEADKRADSAFALADRTLAQLADAEAAQVGPDPTFVSPDAKWRARAALSQSDCSLPAPALV